MLHNVDTDDIIREEVCEFIDYLHNEYNVVDLDIEVRGYEDSTGYNLGIGIRRDNSMMS